MKEKRIPGAQNQYIVGSPMIGLPATQVQWVTKAALMGFWAGRSYAARDRLSDFNL